MITADCHLHSSHSGDSSTPMEDMILQGISQGLTTMCFTEHNDFLFPDSEEGSGDVFLLNTDSYLYDIASLKEKYASSIKLLFGVELGLQPCAFQQNAVYARSYDFDFIIGSSHICNGKDPYYPSFYQGKSVQESLTEYFLSIVDNIKKFNNFDVYGHLDYIVRYCKECNGSYHYSDYQDILDNILQLLIDNEKGIELNTGGCINNTPLLHPCAQVLKRYRQLGGEIITLGSDSHDTKHIANHFDTAAQLLQEAGFAYYAVYEKRYPSFHKI